MPEKVPDTLDSLHISKMWICNSKHSHYPYYILEDKMKSQVGGLGAPDWPLTLQTEFPMPAHQIQSKIMVGCIN